MTLVLVIGTKVVYAGAECFVFPLLIEKLDKPLKKWSRCSKHPMTHRCTVLWLWFQWQIEIRVSLSRCLRGGQGHSHSASWIRPLPCGKGQSRLETKSMAVVASSDNGPLCLVNMWVLFRARETLESLVGWLAGCRNVRVQ